ncbi:Elongin-B [Manis pentadactyla]|nr:Elongin-B [Manis pentadactyla]
MIRRHKTTIFTDAKESSTVFELSASSRASSKRPPDGGGGCTRTISFWTTTSALRRVWFHQSDRGTGQPL